MNRGADADHASLLQQTIWKPRTDTSYTLVCITHKRYFKILIQCGRKYRLLTDKSHVLINISILYVEEPVFGQLAVDRLTHIYVF